MLWAPLSSSMFFTLTSLRSFFFHWHEEFSQSLEPRPRSIYDVLDHSPAGREDQNTAKAEKSEGQTKVCKLWVSDAIRESKTRNSWPASHFCLHRRCERHKTGMKAYLSLFMRIFKSPRGTSIQGFAVSFVSVTVKESSSNKNTM